MWYIHTAVAFHVCACEFFLLTMAQRSRCTMPWHPQSNTRIQICVFKPSKWMKMNCLNKHSIQLFHFTNDFTSINRHNPLLMRNYEKNWFKKIRPHFWFWVFRVRVLRRKTMVKVVNCDFKQTHRQTYTHLYAQKPTPSEINGESNYNVNEQHRTARNWQHLVCLYDIKPIHTNTMHTYTQWNVNAGE